MEIAPPPRSPSRAASPVDVPVRVLVVDDDRDIRDIVGEILLDEGYEVETAPDGQVALERVQERWPAVILLDYRMPSMDGCQFVAAYHQLPGPHARIVLLTAEGGAQQLAAAIGAEGYLDKPFALQALVDVVERHAA